MTIPNFSPLALDILKDRYLWRDANGETIETPEQMLRRVANHVASAEPDEADRAKYAEEFYEIMARLDFLPNSPTLMNAGRPAPHGQLSACFVIGLEDSMADICEALRQQMLIHKSGGGTGFNFSKLRPKGAVVNSTNGKASGPVSFMRLFDLSTEIVQQGGCFTGDTLIATAEGAVKISELKEGTLVYSYHPEKGFILTPCTAPWLTKRNTEIWELETDKGLKVRATPDHPFMYRCGSAGRSKAYGRLRDLLPGTPLMPLSTCVKKGYRYITLHDGKDARNCKVKSVTPLKERADVWNVEIPETHNYVVCNEDCTMGVVVSNTRRGANMAILNADHPDIEEFISCKDEEGKITNFNLSVGITDEFMDRASFYPDGPEAALLWQIARHAWKSGDPGVVFLDAMNYDNPCPQLGRIEGTNPCVTGGTYILTDKGYVTIQSCVGQKVKVWNGKEWSEVEPRVTGKNQPILLIQFSNGTKLECTPYHRFKLNDDTIVEAKNLKIGDMLCQYELPVVQSDAPDAPEKEMWCRGFYVGDGTRRRGADTKTQVALYGKKKLLGGQFVYAVKKCRTDSKGRIVITLKNELSFDKYFVPDAAFSVNDRLEYLAGLIDADGTRNSAEGSIAIAASDKHLLDRVKTMLNTLGCKASVSLVREAGKRLAPDGKGGKKLYNKRAEYRLLISAWYVQQLVELGLKTHRVDTSGNPDRNAGRRVTVTSVEKAGIAEKVYCLTEPRYHMFIANGIPVMNCGESPLLPSESCNLGSINLAHMVTPHGTFDWGRLRDTVIIATRFLDDVIDVNQYPLPEIEKAVKRTRKIGLGVMGWADLLYRLRIPYDSDEAVKLACDIMEHIQALAHIQSWELGLKKGVPEACEHLHRRNATLTCVAPTGTLALLADCSSGIEPVFSLSHTRRITLGDGTIKEVEVVNPHYAELCADMELADEDVASIAKTAYQIPWQAHVAHQAAFQRYTDLAVSKTVNLPADATVEDVLAVYVEAWRQNCKGVTVYRNGSRSSQVLTDNGMPEVKCTTC